MDRYLSRKTFVTTLGLGGFGLAMSAVAPGAARAQDADASAESPEQARAQFEAMQAELYAAFTAALAEELGSGDAAQVDGGIRAALATVVDGYAGDGLVTAGQATALKALIETAEVPVGPGPMMGHGPGHEQGRFVRAMAPDDDSPTGDDETAAVAGELPAAGRQAMADRFYPDFTAALASELGAGSADEVDGAIRLAMISVIDGLSTEDLPMPIPTDALKALVATAESPLGPAMLFGPAMGMRMHGFGGHGPGGPGFHGRGGRDGDDSWFSGRGEREDDDREERGPTPDPDESGADAGEDEESESEESA